MINHFMQGHASPVQVAEVETKKQTQPIVKKPLRSEWQSNIVGLLLQSPSCPMPGLPGYIFVIMDLKRHRQLCSYPISGTRHCQFP
jgi:hypothetical protein